MKAWELLPETNFPCPDNFSVFADPHEDNANIHVPATDRAGDTCVHLVTSPTHHTVYLVRVVWQTVDLPQPSLPLHEDVSHSKDLRWWYIRLCFCLLSVIGLFAKTSVAMKCLPVIRLGISVEGHARNIDISNNGPTQPVFISVVSAVDTFVSPCSCCI